MMMMQLSELPQLESHVTNNKYSWMYNTYFNKKSTCSVSNSAQHHLRDAPPSTKKQETMMYTVHIPFLYIIVVISGRFSWRPSEMKGMHKVRYHS